LIVWSYGGGVQSAAIGVLIVQGKLPRPDLAVIADTGREASSTWEYLRDHMQPFLGGLTIHVAPHSLATVDLGSRAPIIPWFTATGKLPTFCSVEWKRRVVRRWIRSQGVAGCDLWLGISTDELERAKSSDVQWLAHVYPLLTIVPMSRANCAALLRGAGLPIPQRSACFMCPHRSDHDWRSLSDADRQRAIEFEREHSAADGKGGLFLHRSLRPLSEAPYESDDTQTTLDLCDAGHCWT
jgi:hypothetical protein